MSALLRRESALLWALVLPFLALVGFAGSREVFWMGDFYLEIYPAYHAIIAGHSEFFFRLLPAYSGFGTVVGAPASFVTAALGGHETMVFRLTAAPGLLALGAVAVAVAAPVRAAGRQWWPVFLLTGAGGAMTYVTVQYGHPEDLLAAACAVGAVLASLRGRTVWSSVLLVVAVLAKQWAVLAILPAAMAAPRGGVRIAAAGVLGTVAILAVQLALAPAAHGAIATTGSLFHPHQIWWPFGVDATPEFTAAGHGTRMGPDWLQPLTRPIIVGLGGVLAIAWWLRSGAERNRDDALGVLALILLLRCMLDPWDLVYYHLPLTVALTAWEARRGRDLPVLAVLANACAWLTFVVYDAHTGNGPFLAYLAWTLPLAGGLAFTLLRPRRAPRALASARVGAPATA